MNQRVLIFAVAILIISAAIAHGQQTSANSLLPVPAGQVITVTPEPGFNNEPSIAVNPANASQIFATYQMPARVVYSRDAGKSWQAAEGTVPGNYKVSGDVGATYLKDGTAILCYIAFDKLGTENYWAHGATRNGIFIRRSKDGGATWEQDAHAVIEQPTKPGIPFEDKPGVAADTTSSKYAGNLYVGWTEFRIDESVILFSRSTDGGVTWSKPIDISTHHGLPRDDNGAVEGFSAAIGNDGTIYAVWADGDSIAFATSHNGGKSFGKSHSIIQTAPLYFAMKAMDRANGFPEIGIDPREAKNGRLYVTWSDYRAGDVAVYCATSTDGGKSWGKAVRVNSNPVHDGTDQFFQWLAVDPATGAANIIFYDRRNDENNRKTTVTLARSIDGGKTFANYAWTAEPFEPKRDEFLGDYIGVAAMNNKVYGVWTRSVEPKQEKKDVRSGPNTEVRIGVADFGQK